MRGTMNHEQADRMKAALLATNLPTPGLKWKKRAAGLVPYWEGAKEAPDYPVRSANLDHLTDPLLLSARCVRLHEELLKWKRGGRDPSPIFDGTFKALLEIYERDPDSPFNTTVKPKTRKSYLVYLRSLNAHIGEMVIDKVDGRDVKRWFDVWADREEPGKQHSPYRKLGAGRMAWAVLRAATTFGVVCRLDGCAAFNAILGELTFPALKPRVAAPTAGQIVAARKAAHADGAPLRALCYALQYETALRQGSIIGEWIALDDPRPSSIIHKGRKWIGLTWAHIDQHSILRLVHGKTENTTGARGVYDLSVCPMVMEEIERIPAEQRTGPLIVSSTGYPYSERGFLDAWRKDFKAAGIPAEVWNRDLRAGSNTEASAGGASVEDRAKVAGHSKQMNARVYDRDTVEAHRRVMEAKKRARANGKAT